MVSNSLLFFKEFLFYMMTTAKFELNPSYYLELVDEALIWEKANLTQIIMILNFLFIFLLKEYLF